MLRGLKVELNQVKINQNVSHSEFCSIDCLSHVTLNSGGGLEVNTAMGEMKENSYWASSDEITRERYTQKMRTYDG